MRNSIRVSRKYVRRNRPPERGTLVGVRLQRTDLDELDAWIAEFARGPHPMRLSRPTALRLLMKEALTARRLAAMAEIRDELPTRRR
jgi:hypothetical protein